MFISEGTILVVGIILAIIYTAMKDKSDKSEQAARIEAHEMNKRFNNK